MKTIEKIENWHEELTGIPFQTEEGHELPYCIHDDSGLVCRFKNRESRAMSLRAYESVLENSTIVLGMDDTFGVEVEKIRYDTEVLESAEKHHIWLSAMRCVDPTPEFVTMLGQTILNMVDDKANLIYPRGYRPGATGLDEVEQATQTMARLSPLLIIRVNKS